MTCKCGSQRIIGISAHASDMFYAQVKHLKLERMGYAPHFSGISGGDDLDIDFCADCGLLQNFKPLTDEQIKTAFGVTDDEE